MPGGTWVPRPRHAGTSPCPEFPGPDAYPGPLPLPPPPPPSPPPSPSPYLSVFDNSGNSLFFHIFSFIHGKYSVIILELQKKMIAFTKRLYRLNFFKKFF